MPESWSKKLIGALMVMAVLTTGAWAQGGNPHFKAILNAFGASTEEITTNLGPALAIVRNRLPAVMDGRTQWQHVIRYNGLEIHTLRAEASAGLPEQHWVEYISCWSSRYHFPGLNIGDHIDDAIRLLGTPSRRTGSQVTFDTKSDFAESQRITLNVDRRGIIHKIQAAGYFR